MDPLKRPRLFSARRQRPSEGRGSLISPPFSVHVPRNRVHNHPENNPATAVFSPVRVFRASKFRATLIGRDLQTRRGLKGCRGCGGLGWKLLRTLSGGQAFCALLSDKTMNTEYKQATTAWIIGGRLTWGVAVGRFPSGSCSPARSSWRKFSRKSCFCISPILCCPGSLYLSIRPRTSRNRAENEVNVRQKD